MSVYSLQGPWLFRHPILSDITVLYWWHDIGSGEQEVSGILEAQVRGTWLELKCRRKIMTNIPELVIAVNFQEF